MYGITVRIRGGKRQPRYYYHKERGANDLVRYLTQQSRDDEPQDCRSKAQRMIDELTLACRQADELIASIAERWK